MLRAVAETLKFITQFPGPFDDYQIGRGITRIKMDRHIGTGDCRALAYGNSRREMLLCRKSKLAFMISQTSNPRFQLLTTARS
jgi:hypothetical protein